MTATRQSRRMVAWVLAAALASGCGSSATIERRSGPTLEGRIDRSDAERLYVTTNDDERYTIERWDITDIHHPGKVGSIIGGITTGIGVGFLLLAPFTHDCDRSDPTDPTMCWDLRTMAIGAGIFYLLVGLPIWLSNAHERSRSEAAAARPREGALPAQPATLPLRLQPP